MEIQKPGHQLGEKTVHFIFEWRMNHVCEVFTQENPYKVVRRTQTTSHGHERAVGFQQLSFRIVSSSQHPLRSSLWSCPDETGLLPLMLSTSFPPLQMPAHIPEHGVQDSPGGSLTLLPFWPSLSVCASHMPSLCLPSPPTFPRLSAFAHCSACCPLSLSLLNKMGRPG